MFTVARTGGVGFWLVIAAGGLGLVVSTLQR